MAQSKTTVDLQVTLIDASGAPIANAPLRIVFGTADGWQRVSAGTRITTDASGHAALSATVPADTRQRKMPSAFWVQLMASKLTTQHFTVGVELPFFQRPWLYVADVDVFPDGTNVIEAMRMFGADAQGNFTVAATRSADEWTLPGFPGRVMPPGHTVTRFFVQPDAARSRWAAAITVAREREPVMR